MTLTEEMTAADGDDRPHQELEARLAEKDREIAELKDKYLRALADGENARKRIRQQSEESVRIQKEGLLRDLLPIVDNLERAVEAARGGTDSGVIVQGVEMVLRSLIDFLKAQGVTPIVSAGQQFDPLKHEAVDHVPSDVHPPNTVVEEFHRGYSIGDRVLRPARVTVAKGSG
ncbi:MAG TPA: nucleotide exchange factor GrpE [Candidatus Binataceae bacterium]|nr:nucleotide exchange factor GrpE [Candidatus Binataceae bacterium]